MTKSQQIQVALENLCWYDDRHPDYVEFDRDTVDGLSTGCSCDNCFYGRSRLAKIILELV